MTDEKTITELNDLKTSIYHAKEILNSIYQALSITELEDKDLYVELGAWLVEFSTRIGDLDVLKMTLETVGSNKTTDEATLLILNAMAPMRESYNELLSRTEVMVKRKFAEIWGET